jgi:hypothetical protein
MNNIIVTFTNLACKEKTKTELYPLVSTVFTEKVIKQINQEFLIIEVNKTNLDTELLLDETNMKTPTPWYIRFKRMILGGSAACALIAGAWVCHKKSPSLLQRITEKFSHLWNKTMDRSTASTSSTQ